MHTQLKLLIGALKPLKGTIERHTRLRLGYFDQLSVEKLSAPDVVKLSPVQYLIEILLAGEPSVDLTEGDARGILASFGLRDRKATDPIAGLSGGQKVQSGFRDNCCIGMSLNENGCLGSTCSRRCGLHRTRHART